MPSGRCLIHSSRWLRPVVARATTDIREVVNAIFYILRGGCAWRLLPHEFPPRRTVYDYFRS